MKIVMVLGNDFLKPFVDNRVYKEAKALAENGNEVTVICWARTIDNISLNNLPITEKYDRIKIQRVFQDISPPRGSFFIRFIQHLKAMQKIRREICNLKPDVIQCIDFNTLFSTLFIKKKKTWVIYEAREDYPSMVAHTFPKILRLLLGQLEKIVVKVFADAVISVCEPILSRFKKLGLKTALVMNCKGMTDYNVSEEKIHEFRFNLGLNNENVFLYIGSLGEHRGLGDIIEVFKTRKYTDTILLIGGNGDIADEIINNANNTENIKFLGVVPAKNIPVYTKSSDVVLSLLDPDKSHHRLALPNKLFEAMAAGKPVIVSAGTLSGKVVDKEQCGVIVRYGDQKALHNAIMTLTHDEETRKDLGKHGLEAAKKHYNWDEQKKKFLLLYKQLMEDT